MFDSPSLGVLGVIASHLHRRQEVINLIHMSTLKANMQLLSSLSICPPQSPSAAMERKTTFRRAPQLQRKRRGRYHHNVTGAPIGYAHADAYADAYAKAYEIARAVKLKRTPTDDEGSQNRYASVRAHAYAHCNTPDILVHSQSKVTVNSDVGRDGTQLELELKDIMCMMVGMVDFSSASGSDARIAWLYKNSINFHSQYQQSAANK